jgi:hypothetical protein
LTERCGNVVQNKGALWKTPGEAGIYMKTKEMRVEGVYLIENTGFNCRLPIAD